MNMSYCRFQNTLEDLRDCYNHMDEDDELSEEEFKAKKSIITLCKKVSKDYGEDDE